MLGVGQWPFVDDWAIAASRFSEVIGITVDGRHPKYPGRFPTVATPPPPSWPKRLRMSRLNAYRRSKDLIAAVREVQTSYGPIDLLHSHFYAASVGVPRACAALGIPFVHTEHSSWILRTDPSRSISPAGMRNLRRLARAAKRVLFVSKGLMDSTRALKVDGRFEVLGNPVDASLFWPAPRRAHNKSVRLISVGYLTPIKNHALLLDSFAQTNLPVGSSLHIIGRGSERRNLERYAESLGIRHHVVFDGYLPRSEVAEQLRQSDLYVHSANAETFGVAVLEALFSGLPVVTTRFGGILESMPPSAPVFTCDSTPEALAAGIDLAANRARGLRSSMISAKAKEHFSADSVALRLEEIYASAVHETR
ncbi:MAG: glycosyltransferase family 4 protein [Rhodothermales bacterium]